MVGVLIGHLCMCKWNESCLQSSCSCVWDFICHPDDVRNHFIGTRNGEDAPNSVRKTKKNHILVETLINYKKYGRHMPRSFFLVKKVTSEFMCVIDWLKGVGRNLFDLYDLYEGIVSPGSLWWNEPTTIYQ